MKVEWQLAEAKNRFSEVVTQALTKGPQRVSRRGDVVVIISAKEYDRLVGKRKTFKEHILEGPKVEGLVITRSTSTARAVKL